MSAETFESLKSSLYETPTIVVESGADTSRVNEIKNEIVKTEHGLANFMSRYVPQARRFLNNNPEILDELKKYGTLELHHNKFVLPERNIGKA